MIKRLALLILGGGLLALPVCGEDWSAQAIGPFGTLNNTDNSLIIPANKAQDALNVDVTPNGKSVKKREGYGLAFTLTVTTSANHGSYNFFESGGSDVSLFFNDSYVTASVGGGSATVLTSTGPNGSTYQCVDSQGFAYCSNTSRTRVLKTNGTTWSALTINSTGYIIAVTPERLVQAGFAEAPNRIDFSKANDFATWTLGTAATDPINFTINAPGAKLTHITYAFDRLMWFKDSSFGYILVGNQPLFADWQIVTVSPNLGTNDNTSVYWNDTLYFRGQDGHIYAYDGSSTQKLTREITTTTDGAQTRRSNSWTETTTADFTNGIINPPTNLSLSISPNSVTVSSFTITDDTSDEFYSGTRTNVTVSGNNLRISTNSSGAVNNGTFESGSGTDADNWDEGGQWQRIASTSTKNGLVNPDSGSWFMIDSQNYLGGQIKAELIRASDSVALATVFMSSSGNWGSAAIPSAGIIGNRVRLRFTSECSGGSCANGVLTELDSFILGGDVTFKYRWDPHPTETTLGYAMIDTVNSGSSTITSGTFVSKAFDTGFSSGFAKTDATWTANTSSPTFLLQTSSSITGNWTDVAASTGVDIAFTKRWIRYVSTFTLNASDAALTTLSTVTVLARSSGTFYSDVRATPNMTAWDAFGVNRQTNGGSITFYIRSGTLIFTAGSSTPTWIAVSDGAIPTASTGTFIQIRADFGITSATHTPTMNDFTVNWFEGSAADKAYGTYFDNRIWWSIASGDGVTANNKSLIFDLLNEGWLIYDIGANGYLVRNQALYISPASGGYVYRFGDSDSDNGTAINSYWKSKDFIFDSPFIDKEMTNLSVSAKSVANSSMTVTYTVDGSSSTAYTVSLYNPRSSFLRNNRNLPSGRNGQTLNVQFGNNAIDQPFEVFAVQIGYRPKSWAPTP